MDRDRRTKEYLDDKKWWTGVILDGLTFTDSLDFSFVCSEHGVSRS